MFLPSAEQMYPQGATTSVHVAALGDRLCGAHRPGHFDGVTTVCAKLFHLVQPDVAVFGEKDWQQLQILRRMVRDLEFPLKIVSGASVREPDGLALSSRNGRLTASQRERALSLSRALSQARASVHAGERDASALSAAARTALEAARARVDYVSVFDAESLTPIDDATIPGARMAIAAHIDDIRLIDNAPSTLNRPIRSTDSAIATIW